MNEEKIINGYYQSNIKTSRNEDSVYAMKDASQQMLIDKLQQENARLKDKNQKAFKIVDEKITNLNLTYGVDNEFREEYDELWEILKEN